MIFDNIKSFEAYQEILPSNIYKGLLWIKENADSSLGEGNTPLNESDFAIIQSYNTKPLKEGFFENHHRFIDIQYMISGREWIFHAKKGEKWLKNSKEYRNEDDIEFYHPKKEMESTTRIMMKQGDFAIFWPGDLHMPCISPKDRENLATKIVVKIRNEK